MTRDLDLARRLAAEARSITVLTGAGLSTASGIPDFRGPQGVWTQNPKAERISTLSWYLNDPEVRRLAWQTRAWSPVWDAEPNPAHRAITELQKSGRLRGLITSNTDGLHQVAGTEDVIELHGSARRWRCESCSHGGPIAQMVDRVKAGEDDPRCPRCGGITRATVILFEEMLDPGVIDAASQAAADCDLFLAVGTSLVVYPAAGLLPLAVRSGAQVVIVNAEETPFDHLAAAVISDPIETALPTLLGLA
ncbi:MAG: Sir2 family NAD-dependent protein deacetylase [Actinomycetia bacterium]|nr:Sir2 family NAD-dependent protein deacetylase [Actinomycetes bacterium]